MPVWFCADSSAARRDEKLVMRIAGGGGHRGDGESPWWLPSSAGSAPLRSPARVDIPMSTMRDASVVRAGGYHSGRNARAKWENGSANE
jgi:hypothetical protein